MAQVAAGDAEAFEQVYDEFADVVFSIAVTMLRDRGRAEDAAQDVWVKIWNAAGSFDAGRASVATWISTLAHRHVIDLIRRAKVRAADRVGAEPGDEVAARFAGTDDVASRAVDVVYVKGVRGAMQELAPDQRVALELAYFEGLTQREIAEQLGKPIGTVKTYMYQGMLRLRALLDVDVERHVGA